MKYSSTKNKGIIEKGTCEKIVFHRSCSYQHMLKKCTAKLFPDEQSDNFHYYLADSTGLSLSKDGLLSIDDEDGIEKTIPWTLQNYLKVSNIKYASKTKLFCVQRSSGKYSLDLYNYDYTI